MHATNSLFEETTDEDPVSGAENLQDIMFCRLGEERSYRKEHAYQMHISCLSNAYLWPILPNQRLFAGRERFCL
jgi:hypothetical protein